MIRKTLPWLMAFCASSACFAAQIRPAKDGATIEAAIAKDAPTRIRIEGDRIVDVVGNVQSSSGCDARPVDAAGQATVLPPSPAPSSNPRGDITLSCDMEKGEVYVSPVGISDKPISLFVSSPRATYTLRLRRADIEADTIVIEDRASRLSRAQAPSRIPRSAGHVRTVKSMLVAMASEQPPKDFHIDDVERPIALWSEARFQLVKQVEGRGLVGEVYTLTNVSSEPMVLAEQEFDREDGGVVAVAIERHNLKPGDATNVYVIRTNGEMP
jgi:conjugal transfer pilus assembly protein TraK